MQKVKKLSIECVNRIKLESVEEFSDSIFSDVYLNAHMQMERIVDMADGQQVNREAEKFCVENETSNVISFVGERGMGKSSAMLSFSYFLRGYPGNINSEESEIFRFRKDKIKFYTLSKVDAAILTNESLLDVILARMWTDFSEKFQNMGEDNFGFGHTKESFNLIKKAYTLYYKDEKQNRNLASVKQLQELSRSLALREEFARLVTSFLECMVTDDRIAKRDRYLVIPIDDLDLASEKTMAILEQLRIFLSVPQVIVLTTVDIEKLLLGGNKKFSDELICRDIMEEDEKNLVRRYSEQYIAKVLPRNSRISMPRYSGNAAKKYVLDYKKYVSGLVVKEEKPEERKDVDYLFFINIVVAKHLNLIMRYEYGLNAQGESLRNIINKVNELWTICCYHSGNAENFVFDWLEKEIELSAEQLYGQPNSSVIKDLQAVSTDDYNEYIVDYFADEPQSSGKPGYGRVLMVLLNTRDVAYDKRELIKVLITFFSLQIAKCVDEKDLRTLEHSFVRGDIFSSFMSQKGMFGIEGRRRIDYLLLLDLEYNDVNETADSILKKNVQQLVDVFKVFLFCKMENIMDNLMLEIKTESISEKEIDISGEEAENNTKKAVLRIGIQTAVSKVSVDNFFVNVLRYEELFKKYVSWIYEQLKEFKPQARKNRFDALYKWISASPKSGVQEMRDWRKRYSVEGIYDILPVQDVGVMMGVMDRLRMSNPRWRDVNEMMNKLSKALREELKEAEDECLYQNLGYQRYSQKIEELLNCVDFGNVKPEIRDRLNIMGSRFEDTAKIR